MCVCCAKTRIQGFLSWGAKPLPPKKTWTAVVILWHKVFPFVPVLGKKGSHWIILGSKGPGLRWDLKIWVLETILHLLGVYISQKSKPLHGVIPILETDSHASAPPVHQQCTRMHRADTVTSLDLTHLWSLHFDALFTHARMYLCKYVHCTLARSFSFLSKLFLCAKPPSKKRRFRDVSDFSQ